jgi:hypothetical protein
MVKKLLIAACLAAFVSQNAFAAEGGYVQGIYALSDAGGMGLEESAVTSGSVSLTDTIDDSGNGIGFAVGYLFGNGFGIEGGYISVDGFGANSSATFTNAVLSGDTLNGTFSITQDIEGTVLYVAPVAYVDAEPFLLKGKLGFAQFDVENKSRISGTGTLNGAAVSVDTALDSISEDGTSFMFGVSAEYRINEKIGIALGYTRINDIGGGQLTETDVTNLDLSVIAYF